MAGHLPRWLFLRLLGITLGAAVISFWIQAHGLVGSMGIDPAAARLDRYAAYFAREGLSPWANLPTFGWWGAGDTALHVLPALCLTAAVGLVLGIAPRLMLLGGWGLYLSLFHLGGPFLGYQWDILLLETLLVAIPYAPSGWWPRLRDDRRPSRVAVWLLRLLLVKLIFASGVVKLTSGDLAWHDLTAMDFHYWTQPLPHGAAWHAHALGPASRAFSVSATLAIELFAPLLILFEVRRWRLLLFGGALIGLGVWTGGRFGLGHLPWLAGLALLLDDRLLRRLRPRWIAAPRDARLAAFWAIVALMVAIALTGNYGFFQLLTVTLCLTLLDDPAVARLPRLRPPKVSLLPLPRTTTLAVVFAVVVLPLSALQATQAVGRGPLREAAAAVERGEPTASQRWLDRARRARTWALDYARPFASVNSYGLFATMTKERIEIVVEGSADGRTHWRPYRFRYAPRDPTRVGPVVGLHMPRLDWQMWFAALRPRCGRGWYLGFLRALLEGSPTTQALLAESPFLDAPPKAIRSRRLRYTFADAEARAETGRVWAVEEAGTYCPTVTRAMLE